MSTEPWFFVPSSQQIPSGIGNSPWFFAPISGSMPSNTATVEASIVQIISGFPSPGATAGVIIESFKDLVVSKGFESHFRTRIDTNRAYSLTLSMEVDP